MLQDVQTHSHSCGSLMSPGNLVDAVISFVEQFLNLQDEVGAGVSPLLHIDGQSCLDPVLDGDVLVLCD